MDLDEDLLREVTGTWAPDVRYLDEIDSTNGYAMAWAREGASDGSIVVAGHQSAGRGRMDRSWFDRPGESLLFSLILRPAQAPSDAALVGLAAAVALCRAVRSLGLGAELKWPNDVRVGDRKLAGILAEAERSADLAMLVVVGIGVNVSTPSSGFPPEVAQTATSLAAEGVEVDRLDLLGMFLAEFGPAYSGVGGRRNFVVDEYRRLCSTLGRRVRIDTAGGVLEGTAVDLDPQGALVLDSGDIVRAGDVIHLS